MAKAASASNQDGSTKPGTTLRERIAGVDPLILAAGAAVAGAAAGAFVPRSDAETRLLRPVGAKFNMAAGSFGTSARRLLSAEIAAVPLVGQMAVDQIDRVLDPLTEPTVEDEPADAERPTPVD